MNKLMLSFIFVVLFGSPYLNKSKVIEGTKSFYSKAKQMKILFYEDMKVGLKKYIGK